MNAKQSPNQARMTQTLRQKLRQEIDGLCAQREQAKGADKRICTIKIRALRTAIQELRHAQKL